MRNFGNLLFLDLQQIQLMKKEKQCKVKYEIKSKK